MPIAPIPTAVRGARALLDVHGLSGDRG